MDEEDALEKLKGRDNEKIILAVRSLGKETLEACYHSDRDYSTMISIAPERGERLARVPFHSKPSCSLKNSRNAGSSFNDDSSFAVCFDAPLGTTELRRSVRVFERHIWARRPSS